MKSFLKIPQKVDHALHLMTTLAERHSEKKPTSLDVVAASAHISQGYLEEVAHLLRAAGLVEGRRGAGGGYVLARDPRDITVADIITAVEGRCWSEECLGEAHARAAVMETVRNGVWHKVQGQVMTTLHGMTIADIAAESYPQKNSKTSDSFAGQNDRQL